MGMDATAAFARLAPRAVLAAMRIVGAYQRADKVVTDTRFKIADASLVTEADMACEVAVTDVLQTGLPHVPILREEAGWTESKPEAGYFITIDPIDGTRSFTTGGAAATTMLALYSTERRQLIGAAVGHAPTGRIWVADEAGCRRLVFGAQLGDTPIHDVPCQVWQGDMSKTSTVLIDKLRPFKAHGGTKQIFRAEGSRRLHEALFDQAVIQCYGSNGFHQALVADGGYSTDSRIGTVASLTLGMGSWWDCAGALLVVRAGGAARGFWVAEDRRLEVRDPLDPTSYDILLTANNEATLERLSTILTDSFI